MRNILRWLIIAITILFSMFSVGAERVENTTVANATVSIDSTNIAPVTVGATTITMVEEFGDNTVVVGSSLESITTEAQDSNSSILTWDINGNDNNKKENNVNSDTLPLPFEADTDHLNNTITGGKYRQVGCVKRGRRDGRARRVFRYRECGTVNINLLIGIILVLIGIMLILLVPTMGVGMLAFVPLGIPEMGLFGKPYRYVTNKRETTISNILWILDQLLPWKNGICWDPLVNFEWLHPEEWIADQYIKELEVEFDTDNVLDDLLYGFIFLLPNGKFGCITIYLRTVSVSMCNDIHFVKHTKMSKMEKCARELTPDMPIMAWDVKYCDWDDEITGEWISYNAHDIYEMNNIEIEPIENNNKEVSPLANNNNKIVVEFEEDLLIPDNSTPEERLVILKEYFHKWPMRMLDYLKPEQISAIAKNGGNSFPWLCVKPNYDMRIRVTRVGKHSLFELFKLNPDGTVGKTIKRIRRSATDHLNNYTGELISPRVFYAKKIVSLKTRRDEIISDMKHDIPAYRMKKLTKTLKWVNSRIDLYNQDTKFIVETLPLFIGEDKEVMNINFNVFHYVLKSGGKYISVAYLSDDNDPSVVKWFRTMTDGQSLISNRLVHDIRHENIKVAEFNTLTEKRLATMRLRYPSYNSCGDLTVITEYGFTKGHYIVMDMFKYWMNWDILDFDPKKEFTFADNTDLFYLGFGNPSHRGKANLDSLSSRIRFAHNNRSNNRLLEHMDGYISNVSEELFTFMEDIEKYRNTYIEREGSDHINKSVAEFVKMICAINPDKEAGQRFADKYKNVLVYDTAIVNEIYYNLITIVGGGNKVRIPIDGVAGYPKTDPDSFVLKVTMIDAIEIELSNKYKREVHIIIGAPTPDERENGISIEAEYKAWRSPSSKNEVYGTNQMTNKYKSGVPYLCIYMNSIAAMEYCKKLEIAPASWLGHMNHTAIVFGSPLVIDDLLIHCGDGDRDDRVTILTGDLINYVENGLPSTHTIAKSKETVKDYYIINGYGNITDYGNDIVSVIHRMSQARRKAIGNIMATGFGVGMLANAIVLSGILLDNLDLVLTTRTAIIKNIKKSIDTNKLISVVNNITKMTTHLGYGTTVDGRPTVKFYNRNTQWYVSMVVEKIAMLMLVDKVSSDKNFSWVTYAINSISKLDGSTEYKTKSINNIKNILTNMADAAVKKIGLEAETDLRDSDKQNEIIKTNHITISKLIATIYTGVILYGLSDTGNNSITSRLKVLDGISASPCIDEIEAGNFEHLGEIIHLCQMINYIGIVPASVSRNTAKTYTQWGGISQDGWNILNEKGIDIQANTRLDNLSNFKLTLYSMFASKIAHSANGYIIEDRQAFNINNTWVASLIVVNRSRLYLADCVNKFEKDLTVMGLCVLENTQQAMRVDNSLFNMNINRSPIYYIRYFDSNNQDTIHYGSTDKIWNDVYIKEFVGKRYIDIVSIILNNPDKYPTVFAGICKFADNKLLAKVNHRYYPSPLLGMYGGKVSIDQNNFVIAPNVDKVINDLVVGPLIADIDVDGNHSYKVFGSFKRLYIPVTNKHHNINIDNVIMTLTDGDYLDCSSIEEVEKEVTKLVYKSCIDKRTMNDIKTLLNTKYTDNKEYRKLKRIYTYFEELRIEAIRICSNAYMVYNNKELNFSNNSLVVIPILIFKSTMGDTALDIFFEQADINHMVNGITINPTAMKNGKIVDPANNIWDNGIIDPYTFNGLDKNTKLCVIMLLQSIMKTVMYPQNYLEGIKAKNSWPMMRNTIRLDNYTNHVVGIPTILMARYYDKVVNGDGSDTELSHCIVEQSYANILRWVNLYSQMVTKEITPDSFSWDDKTRNNEISLVSEDSDDDVFDRDYDSDEENKSIEESIEEQINNNLEEVVIMRKQVTFTVNDSFLSGTLSYNGHSKELKVVKSSGFTPAMGIAMLLLESVNAVHNGTDIMVCGNTPVMAQVVALKNRSIVDVKKTNVPVFLTIFREVKEVTLDKDIHILFSL